MSEVQCAASISTCLTAAVPDTVSQKETWLLIKELERYFCGRVANQGPKGRLTLSSRIKCTTASPVPFLG